MPVDTSIRATGIGASEISMILGLHPNRTPWDVWALKTGLVEEPAQTPRMVWGKLLERAIAQGYQQETGREIEWIDRTLRGPSSIQIYTPDAFARIDNLGIDCKNISFDQAANFGEPGTDEVPDHIGLQCHWSIAASGRDEWHVAGLFGGNDLRIFVVKRDRELEDNLIDYAKKFWTDHVVKNVAPPVTDSEIASGYLRKKYPRSRATLRGPNSEELALIEHYRGVRSEALDWEKRKNDLEMRIKLAIGPDEGLAFGDEKITYRNQKDTTVTDWESIALGLLTKLPPDTAAALRGIHTRDVPGTRRIYVGFKKEK